MSEMLQAAAFGLPAIAISVGLAYWAEQRKAYRKPKAKKGGGRHVEG